MFIIEVNVIVYLRLCFLVFDLVNFILKDFCKYDFIGLLEIELEILLELDCGMLIRIFRFFGDVKLCGYIYIYVDDVRESRINVRFYFGVVNLVKKGFLGKCDVFYEVNCFVMKGGYFYLVYRFEVVIRMVLFK